MKKIILILSVFIAISNISNAQKGAHVGLQSNLNTVWIVNQNSYGGEEFDYALKLGGGVGLALGYNFSDHLGLQLEVNTSSQGQKYESSKAQPTFESTRDYSLKYITLPVLFKYTSGEGVVKFYFQAGPQFSFLQDAQLTYGFAATDVVLDGTSRYSKTDIGAAFGLGANINVTPFLYINAGLNFFYSGNDINSSEKTNEVGTYTDGTWRWPDQSKQEYKASHNATGGLNIGVHYLFGNK
jgi:opacity protein-like surface antigen